MSNRKNAIRLLGAAVAAASVLVLSGCAGGGTGYDTGMPSLTDAAVVASTTAV